MAGGSAETLALLVLTADEPELWRWLLEVWGAPVVVAVGAVWLAVRLARRHELLGTPRAARRKRYMNSAAKAYERSTRIKRKIPYTEPDTEPEPGHLWLRLRYWLLWRWWLWWLEHRQQRIFDLIVDEYRQDRFHNTLGEHFVNNLDRDRATEIRLRGIVAEELLLRAGELTAERQRRWWRRLWRHLRKQES